MINRQVTNGSVLRMGGAVIAIFGLVLGTIVLLSPMSCTFVGSIQLMILGILFVGGILAFVIGKAAMR